MAAELEEPVAPRVGSLCQILFVNGGRHNAVQADYNAIAGDLDYLICIRIGCEASAAVDFRFLYFHLISDSEFRGRLRLFWDRFSLFIFCKAGIQIHIAGNAAHLSCARKSAG